MPDDTERLFVQLEARISKFEKDMAKAEKRGTKTYNGLSRNSRTATNRMEADMKRSTGSINKALATTSSKIGNFAKGFAPVLGVSALTGTVAALGQVARGIADIGREARRAGIDVESFQELGYVAEQNRIPIDALTDGLKELNLRADEFITTGSGSGADAFRRLGFGADELKKKLENPRDLFIEIIGKLQQLDKAAQIRISDELFGGTAGERFVELLDAGADKIREQIAEARNLGLVLDAEVIARAEEIDKKFAVVTRTVGTALKGAIIEAAMALGQFIDKFREIESQSSLSLDDRLAELGLKRIEIETKILKLKDEQRKVTGVLAETERRTIQGTINSLNGQLSALSDEEAKILSTLSSRNEPTPTSVPAFTEVVLPSTKTSRSSSRSQSRSRSSNTSTIRREREAVSSLIAQLQEEISLVGASDVAKRASEAARRAGTAATDQERTEIIRLNEALFQGVQAENQMRDAAQERADVIRDGLTGIYQDLKEGESFTDSLANAFEKMGDRIVVTLINDVANAIAGVPSPQSGGGLFGGGFSGGGGGLFSGLSGGGGGLFSGLSGGGSSSGLISSLISIGGSLLGVPFFDGGGYTGSGPRSGGVDGKGGFPAILHPRETVIDHTKGRSQLPAQSSAPMPMNVHVTGEFKVISDNDKFQAEVVSISAEVLKRGTPGIVSQSVNASSAAMGKGAFDRSAAKRWNVSKQAPAR